MSELSELSEINYLDTERKNMKKRKYLSEFGINVFTSFKNIIPVEHLGTVKDGKSYHIYSIMATPKMRIKHESIIQKKDRLQIQIEEQIEDKFKEIKVRDIVLHPELDHSKIEITCKYPYNNMLFDIKDNVWWSKYGTNKKNRKFLVDAQFIVDMSGIRSIWELEILYIGQAFGKDGERLATDRLKSHSTLQKILTDYNTLHPDKRIYIFLYEFTPQMQMSFDGLSGVYSTSREDDEKHFNEVINNPLKYNQVINITEAAMINYFKPPYNVNFVENFPDVDHKGYAQYYDLDYNNLVVEIDLEFDGNYDVELWSETSRIRNSWDFIKYDLHNDPKRKSMYDIFDVLSQGDDN